jgi:CRISPR/Cas system-associated exonuclease Cas4 (RecB family)
MTETNERDRSPAGRFTYLVEKRMSKALKAIDSLSNLSDKRNYEYTPSQVAQIIDALNEAVSILENKFQLNLKTKKNEFKLK